MTFDDEIRAALAGGARSSRGGGEQDIRDAIARRRNVAERGVNSTAYPVAVSAPAQGGGGNVAPRTTSAISQAIDDQSGDVPVPTPRPDPNQNPNHMYEMNGPQRGPFPLAVGGAGVYPGGRDVSVGGAGVMPMNPMEGAEPPAWVPPGGIPSPAPQTVTSPAGPSPTGDNRMVGTLLGGAGTGMTAAGTIWAANKLARTLAERAALGDTRAAQELQAHGLTPEQILAVEQGKPQVTSGKGLGSAGANERNARAATRAPAPKTQKRADTPNRSNSDQDMDRNKPVAGDRADRVKQNAGGDATATEKLKAEVARQRGSAKNLPTARPKPRPKVRKT
jgi:hypothetical protein